MSLYVSAQHLSEAWVQALGAVNAQANGTATNAFVSVLEPQDDPGGAVVATVDGALAKQNNHAVVTVANTIFPAALYNGPGFDWSVQLPEEGVRALDSAANDLYETYLDLLPTLQQVYANRGGTYFSRMIAWPGKTSTGANQLASRIDALRNERRRRRGTSNFSDIAVAGEADNAGGVLEEFAVSDRRTRGFPCLVHIDLSVRDGALSVLGVYRNWHLITRGYGNLVGLARLQGFLCQQTGYAPGEVAVVAGHANAERGEYGGSRGVEDLRLAAEAVLDPGRASDA